jgi:hypothetical protein
MGADLRFGPLTLQISQRFGANYRDDARDRLRLGSFCHFVADCCGSRRAMALHRACWLQPALGKGDRCEPDARRSGTLRAGR